MFIEDQFSKCADILTKDIWHIHAKGTPIPSAGVQRNAYDGIAAGIYYAFYEMYDNGEPCSFRNNKVKNLFTPANNWGADFLETVVEGLYDCNRAGLKFFTSRDIKKGNAGLLVLTYVCDLVANLPAREYVPNRPKTDEYANIMGVGVTKGDILTFRPL